MGSYSEGVDYVVKAVEAVGAAIMIVGGGAALALYARDALRHRGRAGAYERLRRNLGRCILLGLEVLIVADIVRTIVVDQTATSVAILAAIVLIRIVLSASLEVELNGSWPWARSAGDRDRV